jgi:hypothetical protein
MCFTLSQKMKLHAAYLIALLIAGADAAFAEPMLPEKIAYHEASTQQVIPYRNGVLVESDHYAANSVMYAHFDGKETLTFKTEGIQRVLDVEPSSSGILFLGLNEIDNQVFVALIEETAKNGRRAIDLPDNLQRLGEDPQAWVIPRLFGTSNAVAAIAGDKVYWLDKTWHNRKLPKVPQFYKEFKPETFGGTHYLDGTTLYAGWDHGEWGGMLASIDLSKEDSKWVHLSGKPVGDKSGIPQNSPIQSIISPKKGDIWVATGLAHMGGTWRGIYHRDADGKWHTFIDGDFDDDRGSTKLPSPSSIQGIAYDHSGQLYILAGEIGVVRLTKGGIDPLINHNFFSHSSDRGDYTVGCYPSALGVARNGDVFVSTNSFGVLAFRKIGDNWTASQFTLKKER